MDKERSFVFGVSVSDYNFIGREQDIRTLKMNFEEGINTILISPRRWGKTSLVQRVRREVDNSKAQTIYLDIFKCKTEYEFYNALAEAVLKQTASKAELWMEHAKDFPISADPSSELSISLGITPKTHSAEEVLQLVENIAKKKGIHIVVCIDEFQQIGEMDDSVGIQKRLRSVWQHHSWTSYCLFGSKKHMMMNMFQKRNMPLYQFGDMFMLERIPTEVWVEYIVSHFNDRRRIISTELAREICAVAENFSSYVQQLAWHVFSLIDEGDTITEHHIKLGIKSLLDSLEPAFMQQIEPLTAYQMNFLRCVASGIEGGYGESAIREEFQLGSYSNITRLKDALIARELIESQKHGLIVSDPIFKRWLIERGW